jgi:hypothetical protein
VGRVLHWIDVPEHVLDRICDLPLSTQRKALERAIHRALDEAGWPRCEGDDDSGPVPYWFVVISDRRTARIRGHVGPISSEGDAQRVARSWKQSGASTRISLAPVGPALTNAGL